MKAHTMQYTDCQDKLTACNLVCLYPSLHKFLFMLSVKQAESLLYKYQRHHFGVLRNAICKHGAALDTSQLGLGKTYVAIAMAAYLGVPLLVVAPKSVAGAWKSACKEKGVDLLHVVTYSWVNSSSKRKSTPKNGRQSWLSFNEELGSYKPTSYFCDLISNGVLLVFDECHELKNESQQRFACHALANAVHAHRTYYYDRPTTGVMMLSGTPADKKAHPLYIFCMAGAMTCRKLFIHYPGRESSYDTSGYDMIVDFCLRIDPVTTEEIVNQYSINAKGMRGAVYDLYHAVLKNEIASSMPPQKRQEQFQYHYRATLKDDQIDLMKRIMCELHMQDEQKRPIITSTLHDLESRIKVYAIIRLARERLRSDLNRKVIIYLDYMNSINIAKEHLQKYKPLVLRGDVPDGKRKQIIDTFQQDNNNYRLLIATTSVGGVGINLDDRHGNYPRTIIINPSFSFVNTVQATGRVKRASTKSESEVYFVYMNYDHDLERKLHQRFLEKLQIANDTCATGSVSIMNDDLPIVTEGVDIAMNMEELESDEKDTHGGAKMTIEMVRELLAAI